MNVEEWKERVAALPCVVCTHLDAKQTNRTTLHHPREGQGMSQRASDFLVTAICWSHHMGNIGLEGLGSRGFYQRYKLDEMDLLAMTIEQAVKEL